MKKTFVVNVAGHLVVDADEEEEAIDFVKERIASATGLLGKGSGFRVESAVEIAQLSKK